MASNEVIFRTKAVLRVKNFTELKETEVMSDVFKIGSDEWRVAITNKDFDGDKYIGICIYAINSTDKTIDFKSSVYMLDTDCQPMEVRLFDRKLIALKSSLVHTKYAKLSQLLDQMDTYLPNNTLTLGFDITVYKTIPFGHNSRFSFRNSFNNKELSDCRLVVGGKELFAWKAILMDRSQVFYNMFTNDMSEKGSNEVIIDDIDANVFKEFLRYLYFGDSDKLEEYSEELLYVCEKYMVWDLKTICANLYFLRINPKNAMKVLEVMNKYGNNELKTKVFQFIKYNSFECLETQWRKDCTNNVELIEQMVQHMKTYPKSKKLSHIMVYTYLPPI